MNIGLLIFSRFDSKRLPGKALLEINGRELLGRVIDRSNLLSGLAGLAVATSDRPIDDSIAQFSSGEGIDVYRGEVDDVAQRAIKACHYFGWDAFVRVCGDRPFHDVTIGNRAIRSMYSEPCDLITTIGEYTLPPGLTTELISLSALERCYRSFDDTNKEHLTSFFYDHPSECTIRTIDYPFISKAIYPTRLVVDTDADLRRARWIAASLEENDDISNLSSQSVLSLARRWDQELSLHGA